MITSPTPLARSNHHIPKIQERLADLKKRPIAISRFVWLILIPAASLPYWSVVNSYFLSDDYGLIWLLHDKPLTHFLSLFATDWTQGIYGEQYDELRPFIAISYRIDGLFGAANPVGYHLSNILLHVANTLLVYKITILSTQGRKLIALTAGLLFAVLAAHSEAVSWISGRADLIPTFAFLLTFLAFVLYRVRNNRAWYAVSVLVFFGSLFTKQSAIVVPLLLVGYDLILSANSKTVANRRILQTLYTYVPYFAAVFAYLALRSYLFGQSLREDHLTTDQLVFFLLKQVYYSIGLLLPVDPLQVVEATSQNVAGTIGAFLMVYAMIALSIFSLRRDGIEVQQAKLPLFFGLFWYVVTVAPLFVTYFSLRHIYFTSVGTSIAIASLVFSSRNWSVQKRLAAGMFVLFLVSHLVVLERTNRIWQAAGDMALATVQQLSELVTKLDDSRVVMALEPEFKGAKLWAFGLPFALDDPFSRASLHERVEIVEHPNSYCCLDSWASDRLDRIEAWAAQPDAGIVVVSWNYDHNRVDMVHRTLPASIHDWIDRLRRADEGNGDIRAQSLELFNALSEQR